MDIGLIGMAAAPAVALHLRTDPLLSSFTISLLAAMTQFATGTLLATLVCDLRAQVTRGFLAMAALISLIAAVAAVSLSAAAVKPGVLPRPLSLAQAGLAAGGVLYLVFLSREMRRSRYLSSGMSIGIGVLILGILGAIVGQRHSQETVQSFWLIERIFHPVVIFCGYLAAALALGTATVGLLLGHWYLVAPHLSSRPLRVLCEILLISLIPLTALAAWYVLHAVGKTGMSDPILWIGAGMITVFPAAVTLAARACCVDGPGRGRSLQAATGLLYIVAACVLAGGLAGNAVLLVG